MLKIKKKEAPSEEEAPEIPSDDASSVPSGMDAPPMNGDNDGAGGMPQDGGMGDGEGNVPDDMPGDGPGEMPSDSMGDDGMGDGPESMDDGGNSGDGGEIESIVSQLSPEDQKAVRSYAQSMLDRSEGSDSDNGMMESIMLKKSQIRGLAENFGPTDDELRASADERRPLNRKVKNTISGKSPFKNPDFE